MAISLVLNAKRRPSARQLARDIKVTKDTAWYMLMRIRKAFKEYDNVLEGIIEADETYIEGKNKTGIMIRKPKAVRGVEEMTKLLL